jgi:hypothetical protein
MPLRVMLRSVEMNSDGETSNVRFELFDLRTRLNIPMVFTVKERHSMDQAVREGVDQLREFADDLHSVVSQKNPLEEKTTRQ